MRYSFIFTSVFITLLVMIGCTKKKSTDEGTANDEKTHYLYLTFNEETNEYTTRNGFSFSLDENTQEATLCKYSGEERIVVIPENITYKEKTYKVTGLQYHCFNGSSSITDIEIPESVTSVGNGCFAHCSELMAIKIPKSVTSMGDSCFYHCPSLTSVEIPESVTSIGMYCFNECTSLTSIKIPASVTSLGDWCFKGCSSLTSIKIPESVTSIGATCFWGCYSLVFRDLKTTKNNEKRIEVNRCVLATFRF